MTEKTADPNSLITPTAYGDVREYVAALDKAGLLRRIGGADPEDEVGPIAQLASTRPERASILFENIKGADPRVSVLSNFSTGPSQGRLIFGVSPKLTEIQALRLWKDHLKEFRAVPPVKVASGPVTEIVRQGDDMDLTSLPWPRWHKPDGGGYHTAAVCVMRDPDGTINMGCYRIELLDRNRVLIYISAGHHGALIRNKYWAQGKPCPIAISLGQEPSVFVGAVTDRPWGASEFDYAGWLRGAPVEIIEGPLTGLPVPARAEIVLEGEMLPPTTEKFAEGPFGEASGYYGGGVHQVPATRINAMMMRPDPILLAEPQGGYSILGSRCVTVWDDLERLGVPGIVAVNSRWALTIIAIKQSHAGHPMRAAFGALGGAAGYHAHFVITVDEDIDPFDLDQVLWAVATRCDPETQVEVNRRIWTNALDPRLPPEKRAAGDLTLSVGIIDACRPYHQLSTFPATTRLDAATYETTAAKWGGML